MKLARFLIFMLLSLLLVSGTLAFTITPALAATTNSWKTAVSGDWTDTTKWSLGHIPDATEDVEITVAGSYTVTLTGNRYCNTMLIGGSGNTGQTLSIQSTATITTKLTASNGVTNYGSIDMNSTSTRDSDLAVTNNSLLNYGTFYVSAGGGGGRAIAAALENRGTFYVNTATDLGATSKTHYNYGALNIGGGCTLTLSGGSQVFNQQNSTISNSGAFNITSAALNFNGGSFTGNYVVLENSDFNIGPGSTGAGNFILRKSCNISGDVASGQYLWINGYAATAIATAANGFTNNGSITLESSSGTYTSQMDVVNGTLVNRGTININPGTGGNRYFNANLENRGTVNINANTGLNKESCANSNYSAFNIGGGCTLTLTGTGKSFAQNGGTLANSGSFDITNAVFNFDGGSITGNAIVLNNTDLEISATGQGYFSVRSTTNFTGNVAAAQKISVNGKAGTYAALVSAGSFINTGTINLETITSSGGASNLTVTSGTFTNTGTLNSSPGLGGTRAFSGNLDNQGTININASTSFENTTGVYSNTGAFNIGGGCTLTMSDSSQVFNQNGGTFANSGTANLTSATFNFNGGNITGNAIILYAAHLNIGAGSLGLGNFSMRSASTISGDIAAAQQINVNGLTGMPATLTAANGFTNKGTIVLETTSGTSSSNLTVTTGVFTNKGVFNISPGTGGTRTFSGDLDNQGTTNINANAAFEKISGVYSNTGAFNIGGSCALTISGNGQVFNQNGGTLANSGTFNINTAAFNFNGGNNTGNSLIIYQSDLRIGPGSNGQGNFSCRGSSTFGGDIGTNMIVNINGITGLSAQLTAADGFINKGTIVLETTSSTPFSNLVVSSGVLTNKGAFYVNPGTGGTRTFSGSLDNQGTVSINTNTTFDKLNSIHTNSGNWNIGGGCALSISGNSQIFYQNGGTLANSGAFEVNSAAFNFNGGITTGNAVTIYYSAFTIGPGSTGQGYFSCRGSSTFAGDIAVNQTVKINGVTGVSSQLTAANGFTNNGTLVLETTSSTPYSNLIVNSGVLTNKGIFNINPGTGGSRTFSGNLDNQGTININTLTNFSQVNAIYSNSKTLSIGGGCTLSITGANQTFKQTASGSIYNSGTLDFNNIDIYGAGTLYGSISPVNCDVYIGSSPGIFNISGNYTQDISSTLNIEIGGDNPGTGYDQLNISGSANLAGTLNISLYGGFLPTAGHMFKFLTYGSKIGDFATVNGLNIGGDMYFDRVVTTTNQTLFYVPVYISVALQGGSRPDSGYVVPLTVKFFAPGTDVLISTPLYTRNLTTAKSDNSTAVTQTSGITPGTYDISAETPTCLTNVKRGVVITAPSTAVDLGTLLEGNANDDNIINIADFGLLAASYGKSAPDYDARTDFDRNGIVNIADFGLLAVNYGKVAPIIVP